MISNSIKKIFALLVTLGILLQSSGLVLELVDLKLSQNMQLQMDIEGDTELEEKKLKIDQIPGPELLELISFPRGEKTLGDCLTFHSFVFEIPFPPPELA
jgi:hypothetical protein